MINSQFLKWIYSCSPQEHALDFSLPSTYNWSLYPVLKRSKNLFRIGLLTKINFGIL